jgi:hypothetical protein
MQSLRAMGLDRDVSEKSIAEETWQRPYIDRDERRTRPEPHRYLHGGFEGTDTRFSFYFPDEERWEGRFITAIEGGQAGHEDRAARLTGEGLPSMRWAFACGAYLVESNGGHIAPGPVALTRAPHPATVTAYAATAAATRFARTQAERLYGRQPAHGYIVGGSGGGRALLGLENTRGIWDGAVQYTNAAGHGVSLPTVIANAIRVLGPQLRDVADAWAPGGSADPFCGLSSRQRRALAELYQSGFQPGGEWQLECPGPELGVALITKQLLADYDPDYFQDFWTCPGYPGADGDLADEIVRERLVVQAQVRAGELGDDQRVELERLLWRTPYDDSSVIGLRASGASPRLLGADLIREQDGQRLGLTCLGMAGDTLVVHAAPAADPTAVAEGQALIADNRDFLAYCHSYLHQVDRQSREPGPLIAGGVPIYPQRALSLQDILVGVSMTAEFDGKLIYVGSVNDSMSTPTAWPVTYAGQVQEKLGAQAEHRLRVYLNDNATHIQGSERPPGELPVAATRLVDYLGSVEQAMSDLIAWVEREVAPPPDTRFELVSGRLRLPATGAERGGIQPVVELTANGEIAITVTVGEPVSLHARASVPPAAGTVISVRFDVDGGGRWAVADATVDGRASEVTSVLEHRFDRPGRYFPAVLVTGHRDGRLDAVHGRVTNLARVRVDVTAARFVDHDPRFM